MVTMMRAPLGAADAGEAMGDNSERRRFVAYLNGLLALHRWNGSDLAARIEVDPSVVSKWRRGERVPNPFSCHLIADTFNLPLREVLIQAGHIEPDNDFEIDPVKAELHQLIDDLPAYKIAPFVGVFRQMRGDRGDADR